MLVEPTARFDEQANIRWAGQYHDAKVRVILGVPGLKVHAKLCLIERLENGQNRYYSCLGTGNFNEDTAKLYTDHMLMTANQEIGEDILNVFRFFQRNYRTPDLKHLVCAPFSLRDTLRELIETEIENAEAGLPAEIVIKINNIADLETTRLLYRASQAGVRVRLQVRSMFSPVTEDVVYSANIQAIGIVDQLLEHSRILIFHNNGERRFFISSADFLPRNFDTRCETLCPIYDLKIQKELSDYLEIHWRDTVKARVLDAEMTNQARHSSKDVRAQAEIYRYLKKLSKG